MVRADAADERRLSRLVARYGRLDLLCLDELGHVQLDTRRAELLFKILTEREEKSSVAVASNLPFSEWGKVIPDARLAAAVIDRVTFNAHIIETGTESYRLHITRQRRSTSGVKSKRAQWGQSLLTQTRQTEPATYSLGQVSACDTGSVGGVDDDRQRVGHRLAVGSGGPP